MTNTICFPQGNLPAADIVGLSLNNPKTNLGMGSDSRFYFNPVPGRKNTQIH